jgi:hypothetical protein
MKTTTKIVIVATAANHRAKGSREVRFFPAHHAPSTSDVAVDNKGIGTMDSLKLWKIEAVVVDDRLTKEIIAERLGSFVMSLKLVELDTTSLTGLEAKPAPVKTAKKKAKPTAKPTRKRQRNLTDKVQARIDLIVRTLGDKSMTIDEVIKRSGLNNNHVVHALLIGEQKRVFNCKLVKVRQGVRPVRVFSVIR